jgi:hypothetical protein
MKVKAKGVSQKRCHESGSHAVHAPRHVKVRDMGREHDLAAIFDVQIENVTKQTLC